MLYVVVFICAGNLAPHDCDVRTARAYQARVEQGVVCGLPTQLSVAQSPISPTLETDEYVKVKCQYQPN